ncbi:MAG TPA: leucine-rich repeat domain-containing protein [Cellvibrio sp.]|nr:leucine-rich repeat domain-containing protein [Cellvibrio sp.]
MNLKSVYGFIVILALPLSASAANFVDLCSVNNPKNNHTREVLARVLEVASGDCAELYQKSKSVTELNISFEDITDLSMLEGFGELESLTINGVRTTNLAPVAKLHQLKELSIVSKSISDLSAIAALTNLEKLTIDSVRVDNLNFLKPLKKLRTFKYDSAGLVKNIDGLLGLTELTELNFVGYTGANLTDIKKLTKLKELGLGSPVITNLAFVENMQELERLIIKGKDVDISAVSKVPGLLFLHIEHSGVKDISALKGMLSLQEVYLGDNKITDISALADLVDLTTLRISENRIENFAPLKDLQQLSFLEASSIHVKAGPETCPKGEQVTPELAKICKRVSARSK